MTETKKTKPKIEEKTSEILENGEKENALGFISFLQDNALKQTYASFCSWKVSYKGQVICYVRLFGTAVYHRLPENSWHIDLLNFSDEMLNPIVNNNLKETLWSNVKHCFKCSKCAPGQTRFILGKRFDNVCHRCLVFNNPTSETLKYVKMMILQCIK